MTRVCADPDLCPHAGSLVHNLLIFDVARYIANSYDIAHFEKWRLIQVDVIDSRRIFKKNKSKFAVNI